MYEYMLKLDFPNSDYHLHLLLVGADYEATL